MPDRGSRADGKNVEVRNIVQRGSGRESARESKLHDSNPNICTRDKLEMEEGTGAYHGIRPSKAAGAQLVAWPHCAAWALNTVSNLDVTEPAEGGEAGAAPVIVTPEAVSKGFLAESACSLGLMHS